MNLLKSFRLTKAKPAPITSSTNLATYNAFKYHWFVWRSVGLQPPGLDQQFKRFLYMLYALILNLGITILFPTTLILNLLTETRTLLGICENLNITVTDLDANIKFVNLIFLRRKMLSVEPQLQILDTKSTTRREKQNLSDAINFSHTFFKIFGYIFVVGTSLGFFMILFASERILMYPAWFPFDWRLNSLNFTLATGYQLIGLIVQAYTLVATDSYPPAYLIILSAHIRNLSYRVEKIGRSNERTLAQNHKDLIECIEDHKIILHLIQTIQEIITVTCISQFFCTGVVQCTVAVYILHADNMTRIAIAIIYFFAVTLEMFLLCHFGNVLATECEKFASAIVNCNWTAQSKTFRKDLLFFIQKSQQQNVIMAGNYVPVTYTTFLSVSKAAYSVFTLLANMK